MTSTPSTWVIFTAIATAVLFIILVSRFLRWHPFIGLLGATVLFALMIQMPANIFIESAITGFISLLQQIGPLVLAGTCLGTVLDKTGAIHSVSATILRWFTPRHTLLAINFAGLMIGIPVFCDSGFIILSRLIPSLAAQTTLAPTALSLSLASGLYTTHTLVPPTAGPLAAAANLGVDAYLGTAILNGIMISVLVGIVSVALSRLLGRHVSADWTAVEEATEVVARPPALLSFTPLVLPVALIALGNFAALAHFPPEVFKVLAFVGKPPVAIGIGLLFTLPLFKYRRKAQWPTWFAAAIKNALGILLITGGGGAFGAVIKNSGLQSVLTETLSKAPAHSVAFLFIAFVIAALLKTAQGSTTSAMIIGSLLVAPLAARAGFSTPYQLSLLVTSIGGGAMCVSHANDSFFWVVSKFGNIKPGDALRSFTLLTFLQGVTVFLISVILFLITS